MGFEEPGRPLHNETGPLSPAEGDAACMGTPQARCTTPGTGAGGLVFGGTSPGMGALLAAPRVAALGGVRGHDLLQPHSNKYLLLFPARHSRGLEREAVSSRSHRHQQVWDPSQGICAVQEAAAGRAVQGQHIMDL